MTMVNEQVDRTSAILAFAHQVLLSAADASLDDLLEGLTRAYGARGAGASAGLIKPSVEQRYWLPEAEDTHGSFPWEHDAALLEKVKRGREALVVETSAGSWLMTAVAQPGTTAWLLWVMDRQGRTWTSGEKAGLPLVAHALAQLVERGMTSWSIRLENLDKHRTVAQAVHVAGRLAHDFGNYLTGILGFTELALGQLTDNPVAQSYLNEVWQAARNGAEWVHNLQSLNRRRVTQHQATDLVALIREQATRVHPLWGETVNLTIAVEEPLPKLAMDPESLRQVLGHILDNAREAISGRGVVTLAARTVHLNKSDCHSLLGTSRAGTFVEVTVTDTGVGLPSALSEQLFTNVFFSTKPRHRGLGLATVYWIVQMHEGGLRFGPHQRQGTTVSVFLPVAPAPVPAGSSNGSAMPALTPLGPGANILVVDDDPLILQTACRILEKSGYRAHGAASAAEALDLYQAPGATYHLIVSDIVMPGMSGLDLTRRLLTHDPQLNVLFISSPAPRASEADAQLVERFGLLQKPFQMQALVQAVQQALTRGGVAHSARQPSQPVP